jgi:hypothetical protein
MAAFVPATAPATVVAEISTYTPYGGAIVGPANRMVRINGSDAALSTDFGTTWDTHVGVLTGGSFGLAWNGSVYCAIDNSLGYSNVSADGITWSQNVMSGGGGSLASNGAGLFVRIASTGNLAYTSTDGIAWTSHSMPAGAWRQVVWNGTLFMAVAGSSSTDAVATSPDGVTWTARTVPTATYGTLCGGGGRFLFATSTAVWTSTDGASWTGSGYPGSGPRAMIWTGSVFLVHEEATATGYTTSNGTSWGSITFPLVGRNYSLHQCGTVTVAVYGTSGLTFASGNLTSWYKRTYPGTANVVKAVDIGDRLIGIADAGAEAVLVRSLDRVTWEVIGPRLTEQGPDSTSNWTDSTIAWDGVDTIVIACAGYTCGLARSADRGASWTVGSHSAFVFGDYSWRVVWSGTAFVLVVSNTFTPKTKKSADGVSWTGTNTGLATGFIRNAIVSGNGKVVVGGQSAAAIEVSSNDGVSFSSSSGYVLLGFDGAYFYRVAQYTNNYSRSSDCVTWTDLDVGDGFGGFNIYEVLPVGDGIGGHRSNNDGTDTLMFAPGRTLPQRFSEATITGFYGGPFDNGGQLSAFGDGTGLMTTLVPNPLGAGGWVSADIDASSWNTSCHNGAVFVAGCYSDPNTIGVSADGHSWTSYPSPFASGYLIAVAAKPDGTVCGLFDCPGGIYSATSPDGITWTLGNLLSGFSYSEAIAWGNGGWVALNLNSTVAATSPDGLTWTASSMPVSTASQRMAFGAGQFVAGGSGTNLYRSPDGLTWTASGALAGLSSGMADIKFSGSRFCVIGYAGTFAYTSSTALTWVESDPLPSEALGGLQALAWDGVRFTAVQWDADFVLTSPDGLAWANTDTLPLVADWYTASGANGVTAALAYDATPTAAHSPIPAPSFWTDFINCGDVA